MNNNLANIKKSISFLNKDDCVAIPTETVYGLAANAYSSKAVRKIYTFKCEKNLQCKNILIWKILTKKY